MATLGQVKDALDKRDEKIGSLKEEITEILDIKIGSLIDDFYILTTNGKAMPSSAYKMTDYIYIKDVKKIVYPILTKMANIGLAFYSDRDESTFISGYDIGTDVYKNKRILVVPNGAEYVRFCCLSADYTLMYLRISSFIEGIRGKQDLLVKGVNLDEEPSKKSDNPVTSKGVYNALKNKLGTEALSEILEVVSYTQLLNSKDFLVGKQLQTTALVSTPDDMTNSDHWTTTNLIELDWNGEDGGRTFETNLKTGQFMALGYFLYNGKYVRSAFISTTEEYDGHYKFTFPIANVKMRLSIRNDLVKTDDIIITKSGEWTTDPSYGTNILAFKEKSVKKNSLAENIQNEIFPVNPCEYRGNEFQIFKKVLCIGDSLTEGTFDYFEGSTRKYFVDKEYSYPSILSALTGRNVVNKGFGGDTFHSWYERYKNEDLSGFDCAIIELGLNDSTQNTTSADRLEYLGKIVSKLKSENNGIKIFISTVFKCYSNNNIPLVNADIMSFANSTDNCYLMNVYENGHLEPNSAYVAGHLTVLGYQRLARDYYAYASKIISENMSAFQYVQYIGSDKRYQ